MTLHLRWVFPVAVTAVLATACGGQEAAPQETSSTAATSSLTTAAAAPTVIPPTSVPTPMAPPAPDALPFRDYLESIGVFGQPVPVSGTEGLTVTVPLPAGWTRYTDPIFATGVDYVTRGDDPSLYPSVQLMAIQLNGEFDPRDALRHATTDALPAQSTDAVESFDDYRGFPSAMAQGVDADSENYVRMVIVDVPSTASRYLVELIVATKLDEPIASSPDLQEIINGFTVTVV